MPAHELREAVICEPVRTAVGRMGGMYRNVSVGTLAQAVLRGIYDCSTSGSSSPQLSREHGLILDKN